jgi:hypothetical protein
MDIIFDYFNYAVQGELSGPSHPYYSVIIVSQLHVRAQNASLKLGKLRRDSNVPEQPCLFDP